MSPQDHYLVAINASLSLIFKTMALYIDSKGEESIKDLNNVFIDILNNLQTWICDTNVIGGAMFGNAPSQLRLSLQKCIPEVKVSSPLVT